jgi:hypothetical protein
MRNKGSDDYDESTSKHRYQNRKRARKKIREELEYRRRAECRGLRGYFRYNQDAPCKTYTQEELDKLNKEMEQKDG